MEKGQIVFVKTIGYNSNRNDVGIIKSVIVSVGKKYFTLEPFDENGLSRSYYFRNKFSLEDMREVSNYSSNYKVYLSEKEIQDEIDRPSVKLKIDIHLSELTTDELREVLELLTKNFK